ncbi:CASP-like protein [Rhynchospora pubera]|uniref:CASP-like protein n=1 Tax=Rhynchospora pubera TaxID=906938 RepID=A0AAV8H1M0_9POAL|nr:CASP-like protein [Rhynchospora pubera]
MGEAKSRVVKVEGALRFVCMVLAAMTAMLMGLNAQTKTVFFIQRKASAKDIEALWILTMATAAAAGYNFLQLLRCIYLSVQKESSCCSNRAVAWLCFVLDQAAVYAIFATTLAALQGAMIALTGIHSLQWSKLCNIYTRYCVQVGGSLFCSFMASLAMALVALVSAYRLFRLYPSQAQPVTRAHR